MRSLTAIILTFFYYSSVLPFVTADRILESNSLNSCQEESAFSASLFNVVVTPNNSMASCRVVATVTVSGNVLFDIGLFVYGHRFIRRTLDPCAAESKLSGMCPMTPGKMDTTFNVPLGDTLDQVPGIAYTIPDLDANIRVFINSTDTGKSVACVEAAFSTGRSVESVSVKWFTAGIIGLGLISAAIVSTLGHNNAAAHLAANTMSLIGYFQAQAIVGLMGVHMPPIVQAWTQNFQWSMGIIRVGWMQHIFTWYQRATGGEPATLFSSLGEVSVQVTKRSLDYVSDVSGIMSRGIATLSKKANVKSENGSFLVYGIQRVAYRAKIETTNLFLTGLMFFYILILFSTLAVILVKLTSELCVRQRWLKSDRLLEFRSGWLTVLKGIFFRLSVIGLPQITILCLWEFTQIDSPALVVLAVVFFIGILIPLCGASFQMIRLARMHSNPAYTLFSNPQVLNRLGFLYIQFCATSYYFAAPLFGYAVLKGIFIAFGQHNGLVQAIALLIFEAIALISFNVFRPWMDKTTNSVNIAIQVLNFLNAIFLLIFTNVFGAPGMVGAIVGIVLFVANAICSLVLLLMIIISSALILWRKNPDARYRFMADDRTTFMKSRTELDTDELDALAVTARGDKAGYTTHMVTFRESDSEPSHLDGVRRS